MSLSLTDQEMIELLGTEHILYHHALWDWCKKVKGRNSNYTPCTTESLKQTLGPPGTLVIVYDDGHPGDGPDGIWTMSLLHVGKMNVLHNGKTWHIKQYEG